MQASTAFEFGRDFQKLTEENNFKQVAAYVANGDATGQAAFYKLKPLFDKYGYEVTIAAIKEYGGEIVETRPAVEKAEVVKR